MQETQASTGNFALDAWHKILYNTVAKRQYKGRWHRMKDNPELLRLQILKLYFDAMNLGNQTIELTLRQEMEVKRNADPEEHNVMVTCSLVLCATEEHIFQMELVAAGIFGFQSLPMELGAETKAICRAAMAHAMEEKIEELSQSMGFMPICLQL